MLYYYSDYTHPLILEESPNTGSSIDDGGGRKNLEVMVCQ